ncbi:dinitrogenase iron-molybdenum cofactor biosynthesis protein [bacterium]|nr:dinitrogenase iron-molybdenum cofactor biosynthesis protein [bacterium]MCB2179289.1 dinitrogenase iron-molybdenum cofactor biosynthesis protein [bacterium]
MKIAVVTDDGKSISQHFGRATKYAVYDIQEGKILSTELRDKAGHHTFQQPGEPHHHDHDHGHAHEGRGMDAHSADKHALMVAAITDCEVLLCRGMGRGAFTSMEQAGIKPLPVDFHAIEEAIQALMDGKIDEHIHDQLCGEHGHHHH